MYSQLCATPRPVAAKFPHPHFGNPCFGSFLTVHQLCEYHYKFLLISPIDPVELSLVIPKRVRTRMKHRALNLCVAAECDRHLYAWCRILIESEYPSLKRRKREQECCGYSLSVLVTHTCRVVFEIKETKVRVEYATNDGSASHVRSRIFDRLNSIDRKCVLF